MAEANGPNQTSPGSHAAASMPDGRSASPTYPFNSGPGGDHRAGTAPQGVQSSPVTVPNRIFEVGRAS